MGQKQYNLSFIKYVVPINECSTVVSQCHIAKRLQLILHKYHHSININNDLSVVDILLYSYPNSYFNVNLLNDYHHIIHVHSKERHVLKNVNNNLDIDICNSSNCVLLNRHCRNRHDINNGALLFDLYHTHDGNTRTAMQLLDRLHSLYFHSHPQTNFNINNGLKSFKTNQKFITNIKEYQCGVRYFYWKYYQHNKSVYDDAHWASRLHKCSHVPFANANYKICDLYVEPKYASLAQEMQSKISIISWKNELNKAETHIESIYFKSLYCPRLTSRSGLCYEMKYKQGITVNHLLSVQIYCGYDVLQSKFTRTYWPAHETETLRQMKDRHKNFYFLGRFLRECVECFGMKWDKKTGESLTLHHGVSEQFTFSSLFACVKGPLSATTDYAVATNFAQQGIIISLKINADEWRFKLDEERDTMQRICCFEAYMISDFPNENEILLLGGLNHFSIVNIVAISTGNTYKEYISALAQSTANCVMKTSWGDTVNSPTSSFDKALVHMLFDHQISGNPINNDTYLNLLIHTHFESVVKIQFGSNTYKIQKDFFFDSNE
eukprot:186034_1